MGPIDYSTSYVCGLLIDGFKVSFYDSHNPPCCRPDRAMGFRENDGPLRLVVCKNPTGWVARLRRLADALKKRLEMVTFRPVNLRDIVADSGEDP